MKSLLSYLLLLSTIGYSQCSIYEDQTNNANNKAVPGGEGPMHFACALGYNLRPGIPVGGEWKRQVAFDQKVLDKIRDTAFPVASQARFPKLSGFSLQNIAADAYVGYPSGNPLVPWDTSGADNNCSNHGYGYGT